MTLAKNTSLGIGATAISVLVDREPSRNGRKTCSNWATLLNSESEVRPLRGGRKTAVFRPLKYNRAEAPSRLVRAFAVGLRWSTAAPAMANRPGQCRHTYSRFGRISKNVGNNPSMRIGTKIHHPS